MVSVSAKKVFEKISGLCTFNLSSLNLSERQGEELPKFSWQEVAMASDQIPFLVRCSPSIYLLPSSSSLSSLFLPLLSPLTNPLFASHNRIVLLPYHPPHPSTPPPQLLFLSILAIFKTPFLCIYINGCLSCS